MKKLLFIICILVSYYPCIAQQTWFFGHNAGIKFNTNPSILPTAFGSNTTNPIYTNEGCAIAYDGSGNIIFSTDGTTVYNSANAVMTNGSNLLGGTSATQSAIIIPVPGCECKKYFVFTIAACSENIAGHSFRDGLNYSVVDISTNSVVQTSKNTPLVNPSQTGNFKGYSSEKLTAIKDGSGGYWVIAHGTNPAGIDNVTDASNESRFYAFHITASNIGSCTNPTISKSDCVFTDISTAKLTTYGCVGQMKISLTGSKIAYTTYNNNTVDIFDFNISTGIVSNHNKIGTFNYATYGLEFSPNQKYLYVTETWSSGNASRSIYQLDLSLPSGVIFSSKTMLHTAAPKTFSYGQLQLWTDGRIYVANYDDHFIGVINSPDLPGSASNYLHNAIALPTNTTCYISLPTFAHGASCSDAPPLSTNPCCPPWNKDVLKQSMFYQGSGSINLPYTLLFQPTSLFKNQMQAYLNYLHLVNSSITGIAIEFRLHDQGSSVLPNTSGWGSQIGSGYIDWNWNTTGVSSMNPSNPILFPNNNMQVGTWYAVQSGMYLNSNIKYFPDDCAENTIYVRIQVMSAKTKPAVRGDALKSGQYLEISDGKKIIKTIPLDSKQIDNNQIKKD